MVGDRHFFGIYLKKIIKEAGYTQSAFFEELNITKPYFYDILSGKVNPPPPKMQRKIIMLLKMNKKNSEKLFDLAAKERKEIPADIVDAIFNKEDKIAYVRKCLENIK